MKRQLTALLLAMTFVLATVSPTLAAKPAKESGNRTATVSVEKPKKEKSKFGAFIDKLTSPFTALLTTSSEVARDSGSNADSNSAGAQSNDSKHQGAVTGSGTTTPPANPVVPPVKPKEEDHEIVENPDKKDNKEEKVGPVEFTFNLVDENGKKLSGAILTLTNEAVKADDKPEKPFVIDENPKQLKLEAGKYKLEIIKAPKGYKESSAEFEIVKSKKSEKPEESVEFKVEGKTLKVAKVEDKIQLTMTAEEVEESKLFFSLRGIENKELVGAKIKIEKDGVKSEETIEMKDKRYELSRVEGKYELTVTQVPEGYKPVNDTIKFEIDEKGELKVDDKYLDKDKKDGNETLFLKAEPIGDQFFFRLKDSNGKDIIGPELQIKDSTGKVIKWLSEKNPKGIDIKEFSNGDYEFSQTTVPYGYTAAEPIRFTVKDHKIIQPTYGLTELGSYQELALVSKNAKRVVTFSRVDVSGKALLGNEIEIYKDGIKIASWKSGSDSTKLELQPGVYKYHEASAATGHKVAKDFDFEIKTDGTITLNNVQAGENVKLKEGGLIVVGESAGAPVEDPNKKPETKPADKPGQGKSKGSAQVQNVWVEFSIANKSGVELSGATVEILQNGKSVASWTTSTTSYKVKLQPGSYRFHTKTAPQGYQLARDFNFAVNRDGSIALGKIQSGDTGAAKDGKITVYGDPVTATGARATGTSQGTQANNGKLPKTGDGVSPVVYAAGLAAVGAVVLGIGIKKRRQSVDEAK